MMPCRISDTAEESPKALCITLLPFSRMLNSAVMTTMTKGFSRASQATMMAVKPTPPAMPSLRL